MRFYDLARNLNLTGWQPLPKARSQLQGHTRHFLIFSAWSLKIHLASFLSHNFTSVIMPEMQYNKLTMWYFILLYFSASDLLIGSQQTWCHRRFFGGKLLRVYCWEKISLPSSTRPSIKPSQLFCISLYSCSFILWPHKKTPDPKVGLGARLYLT